MSALAAAAINLGAALLPTLIEELDAALDEGLDEKAATERALERMRAARLPEPVTDEIARRFADARAALGHSGSPRQLSADEAAELVSLRALRTALEHTYIVTTRDDRVVLIDRSQTGG